MNLENRVVLVSGGSRGIGRACCMAFAEKGCHVAVNFNKSKDKATQLVKAIQRMGRGAIACKADVSVSSQVKKMIDQVHKQFGKIDILVSNAGMYYDEGRKLVDMSDAQWDRTMAVNLRSTFLCCRAVAKEMIARREGKIIIIGSCAGIAGQWTVGYCASKGGQQSFAMALTRELMPFNVHVNLVAPGGAIDTDMHAGWLPGAKKQWDPKKLPSGRYPLESGIGSPHDIAHAVIFVAENDHVNGEILKVSGGTCICP